MIKITPKVAILSVSILAVTAGTTGLVLSQNTTPKPEVKGVSTNVPSTKKETTPTTTSTATTVPAVTGSTNANSSVPADERVAATKKTPPAKPAISTPPVTSIPPAPVKPAPEAPKPQPSFHLAVRTENVHHIDLSDRPWGAIDAMQIVVPFDIVYDEGFVPSDFRQSGCRLLTVPQANHGVLCDVGQKEAGSGTLVMQFNDASASGRYVVEILYPIGETTRTATYEFTLE